MKFVTATILVMLLAACSSYQSFEGEALPDNEVAVIGTPTFGKPIIIGVDGDSVPITAQLLPPTDVTLMPGCHTLTYSFAMIPPWWTFIPPYYGCATAVINAEAGHRYEASFSSSDKMTILDLTTQKEITSVPAQERRNAFETCKVPTEDLCAAANKNQPETN